MGKIDTTLFIKLRENDILIVQIYVDDIIFGATNVSLCEKFAKSMHSEFEMSMMGELNFFLSLQIKQLKEGTFINQAKYIRDLLKKFNLEEVKVKNTPMGSSIKLDMDEKGKSVNQTKYRGMIGSLLYLTTSRPDIMYSVCLCARFQACPKESHLNARFQESCPNNTNLCVLKGKWSPENCYLLSLSGTCCSTLMNNSNIWHRRLGHISPRSLNETIATYVALGIPKMKADPGKICSSCQLGKQFMIPHKVTQHMTTTRILE